MVASPASACYDTIMAEWICMFRVARLLPDSFSLHQGSASVMDYTVKHLDSLDLPLHHLDNRVMERARWFWTSLRSVLFILRGTATIFSAPNPNLNSLQEAAKILHQGLSVLQPTWPLHRLVLSMAKRLSSSAHTRVLANVNCWLVLTFGTLHNSLPLNFLDDSGADLCLVDKT